MVDITVAFMNVNQNHYSLTAIIYVYIYIVIYHISHINYSYISQKHP